APAPAPVAAPTAVPVAATPVMPPAAAETPATPPSVAETPAVAEPVGEPVPAPLVEVVQGVAPRASEPSRVNTERKPPLMARIERLERKLRASSLSPDEKESARRLLQKVRGRAESAATASERKQVKLNLDIWERQYLGN
ncbi:MAG TPA: hypothetical protein VGB96_05420, partial [Archangium sp.]